MEIMTTFLDMYVTTSLEHDEMRIYRL